MGLDGGATAQAVRAAYLSLLRVRKPDRDLAGFQRLREAYELLLDQPRVAVPPKPEAITAPPDEKSALRAMLDLVGPDEPSPVVKLEAIDALLRKRPGDVELIAWLVRELFLTGLFPEAVATAHAALRSEARWRPETEPLWIVVADLFPDQFNPLWLLQAAEIDSVLLRLTVAEGMLRMGRIVECFEMMTRLLQLAERRLEPFTDRIHNVLMVLTVAKPKRAAPLVETALEMAEPTAGAMLREVRDNVKKRWIAQVVQASLPLRMRLVRVSPDVVARLPAEVAEVAPTLAARVRSVAAVTVSPSPRSAWGNASLYEKIGVMVFVLIAIVMVIDALFGVAKGTPPH